MFKKIFIDLCNERKVSPSAVCKSIGLSNATFSQWTEESIPRRATLQRIADYFGVSLDYLLGQEKEKPADEGRLSEDEKTVLEWFKSLTQEEQLHFLHLIRAALHARQ